MKNIIIIALILLLASCATVGTGYTNYNPRKGSHTRGGRQRVLKTSYKWQRGAIRRQFPFSR
jgi:hypothetical protein